MNQHPLLKNSIVGFLAGLISSLLVINLSTSPENLQSIEPTQTESTESFKATKELWTAVTALQASQQVLIDRLDDLANKMNSGSRTPLNGFASKDDLDALKRDLEGRSKELHPEDMKAGVTDALKSIKLEEVVRQAREAHQRYESSIESRTNALAEILNLDDYQYESLLASFSDRAMRGASIIESMSSGATPEDIQIESKNSELLFWDRAEEFLSPNQIRILKKAEP